MCNVCDAETLIRDRIRVFGWEGTPHQIVVALVHGDTAEFAPYVLRFARTTDGKSQEDSAAWTTVAGDDLAGAMGALGVDVKWAYAPEEVRAWLEKGGLPPVIGNERDDAAIRAAVAAWTSDLTALIAAEGLALVVPPVETDADGTRLVWPRVRMPPSVGIMPAIILAFSARRGVVRVTLHARTRTKHLWIAGPWEVRTPQELMPWLRQRNRGLVSRGRPRRTYGE